MRRIQSFCISLCALFIALPTVAQGDYLASLERPDGVALHIESFAYRDTAGRFTPANGVYLVMLMTIDNHSGGSVCIVARNIRLVYNGEEYPPERALMSQVQRDLSPRRDYVGPITGHCVDDGDADPSFAAFDVPADMDSFIIRFDDVALEFADLEPVGTPIAPTPRPTSPPRPTAPPRPTNPPRPTATPVPASSADAEDADTISDGIFILAGGRDVRSVRVVDGRPNGGERVAIITYVMQETGGTERVEELLDILDAVAAAISSDDLDIDSVMMVLGLPDGMAGGIATVAVSDLLDFYEGRITKAQFIGKIQLDTF